MQNQRFFLILTIVALVMLLVVSIMFFVEFSKLHTTTKYGKNTKKIHAQQFPPTPARCPDYWKTVGVNKCENVRKLGQCNLRVGNSVMDFNKYDRFKGEKGPENKCLWAKECNVPWEGIDTLC